ncbi:HAD-IIIC family phosphatase [Microbispora triticiradicis]|uniref:HAD-IIIC family phosphatase n=1 Tax=Microbispora triticiradicis TaxID=2200763 RepID=A0ABX9LEL5_9ACTN|nr:HAD-IIIC family phosphatase [Microbispora triticiradicis]RGA02083.1 HAD-IIIC family phosphatase [Microbispora triticiradicis]GLW24928.1 HAD-superfamily phosphatase, subfamily IIIC:FkbH [Microbispora amethystogenes]
MTTDTAAALARLRLLHREGALAERFDEVAPLLAAMSAEDAARAARLLAQADLDAVRERHPDLPRVRVTVTGHGTLEALRVALVGELARHGYVPSVRPAGFGSYVFELGDPGSELYAERPDLVVCVLDHATVFDEVGVPFTAEDVERVLGEKLALWRGLAARYAASGGSGTLVLNTVPLPRLWQARLLDHGSRARLGAAWRRANAELLELGASSGRVVVTDLDPLLTSATELADSRFATYAGANLSDGLLGAYARELAHLVRARTGRAKKVLALDLDGTLWGGVLGDDGVEGIEVGRGPRGEAFRRFQDVVKQLGSQGVLLAAVSKNDREPVLAALRDHPGMVLREDDFVRVLANWSPKPGNLRTLVEELNLGGDSVVFADDSPYECAAVAAELPETVVVHLDGDPATHADALLADGWFTTTEVTAEDRVRTRRYHEEAARSDFLAAAGSAERFLAGLGVSVRLAPARPEEVARLSQITLRTNQFNLTTERLSPEEVRERAGRPDSRVLTISSADRFGGNGLVGAVFLRARPDGLLIENFLLSCRVFARGIEQAVLSAVLHAARDAGFPAVRGRFLPTAKNGKVRDLYPHYGFAADGETPGESPGEAWFVHGLEAVTGVPAHLTLHTEGRVVPEPSLSR